MTSWGWGLVLGLRPKRKSEHEVVPGRRQDVGKDKRQVHSSNGRWVWLELKLRVKQAGARFEHAHGMESV